jgi:hypothetical protein
VALTHETAGALVGGFSPEKKMAEQGKTKVKAVRGFYWHGGKIVKPGDELEMLPGHAREQIACGKVVTLEAEPEPVTVEDKAVPGVPSAAVAKEAENVKKQDAARSASDKAVIKDEADAEKRSKS